MSKVIAQSIFTENVAERRSWQSYATSGAVHVAVIALLFVITFPAVTKLSQPEHVTLIAPVLPEYKPKVIPRPAVRPKILLKQAVQPVVVPKKFVPPPVVKPPEVKRVEVAKAPEIKAPAAIQHAPEVKVEAPAPLKAPVKTGLFETTQDLAKGPKVPNQTKVGGFGDPNGVHPQDNAQQGRLTVAKLGGFDMPNGEGQAGGGGRGQNGGVKAAGFGSFGDANGVPGGTGSHGSVKTGGFGETSSAPQATHLAAVPAAPATTQVEILFKPKPAYTTEARQMGLEGKVAVEVTFTADGTVKVRRIAKGLGHGLDEAAEQAATQVRFKPATRGGVPVDTNATIYITFELT